MTVTLVQEEGQREHPRYRIPASIEIDGWTYPVREWAIDGFTVNGMTTVPADGELLEVNFIFRLDGFSLVVDLDAEVVSQNSQDKSVHCRFHNLREQQLALMRAVIDAYLVGEFLFVGDLIQVVKRASNVVDPSIPAAAETKSRLHQLGSRARRVVGLAVMTILFVGLLWFITWIAYQRIYVVESLSATVSAAIVVIRSPQPSYFEPIDLADRTTVNTGEPIAFVELLGGGSVTIDSPCNCKILDYHTLKHQFAALGEPLMTLLPIDETPYISAKIELDAAKKISLGNQAQIRLIDGQALSGIVEAVVARESIVQRQSAPLNSPPSNITAYHEVIIRPDQELSVEYLDSLANVRINTSDGFAWVTFLDF